MSKVSCITLIYLYILNYKITQKNLYHKISRADSKIPEHIIYIRAGIRINYRKKAGIPRKGDCAGAEKAVILHSENKTR